MPALTIHRRQEPVIESSSPPSPKPDAKIEDPAEPPAPKDREESPVPKEPTTRRTSSAVPTETGGGLAGLFDWGSDESSSSAPPPTRTRSIAHTPEPRIEDSGGFFGFGGDDETTSSSRPTARPTSTRTYSRDAEPTETGPGLIDGMDNVIQSCGGSQDSTLFSEECKDVAQDNLIGAIILAIGALILFGFLILILKWFYVKFKSRRAPPRAPTPASERV